MIGYFSQCIYITNVKSALYVFTDNSLNKTLHISPFVTDILHLREATI